MSDTDELLEATTALVPPLLTTIDVLQQTGRYLHPPDIMSLIEKVQPYRQPLADGIATFQAADWPAHLEGFSATILKSASLSLQSINEFLSAQNQSNPVMGAYRALGYNTKAIEAAYPVSFMLPPVSRFFLDQAQRDDEALLDKIQAADPSRENVGVMHASNGSDERGGFSIYVPEYYADEKVPLIVALHGGSGHGRNFLWTWLRTVRSRGAVLISPTSAEGTWSLMGPDIDTERLESLVAYAKDNWNIDDDRVLLTGMSDGGTFTYVSGLQTESPFTHLAPSSASFHPMIVEATDPGRLADMPIYLMHGALDWMFPIDVARSARDTFAAAGAQVTYREIEDLSHTYPIEENPLIFDWLLE